MSRAATSATAPRAAPPRRGRDGAGTRARIEGEALRLFAQRGVAGTSVRDIAQAAGVAEGALYRHFPSKEELARDLFLTRYAELAAAIGQVVAAEAGFGRQLAALVRHACALFDEDRALFAYLLITQHDHLAHVPAEPARNLVATLEALFTQAIRDGEIPPQDVALAVALALGAVVQPAVFALYGRLEAPLSPRADAIAAAIGRMLGCAPGIG
ncbi:TetR/AcrR family transcriptional regulator [Ancylobacter terrae]|uniref:TetR/AcrR family transcriptional regulator n=1 Tax=Ancylobacter sp. sgz301288 TaxID=3342077 RepID=UPI00385B57A8